MISISKNNKIATLINVFTVEPENQSRLVQLLTEGAEKTIKKGQGFVSVSIHKSADGLRVVNYAQWKSREDAQAMAKNPEAQAQMKAIAEIAKADFHLYEVVDTVELS